MPAPFVSDRSEGPHTQGETAKTEHHQPAQVDTPGEKGVERNRTDLKEAGGEHSEPDLQCAEAAHASQEEGGEIDCRKDGNATDEGKQRPEPEIADLERREIDDRLRVSQASPDKT